MNQGLNRRFTGILVAILLCFNAHCWAFNGTTYIPPSAPLYNQALIWGADGLVGV